MTNQESSEAKSELPKSVWISTREDGGLTHIALFERYEDKNPVEYIRADICEALNEKLKVAEEALDFYSKQENLITTGFARQALEKLRGEK